MSLRLQEHIPETRCMKHILSRAKAYSALGLAWSWKLQVAVVN